jgi:transposase, IS5 family
MSKIRAKVEHMFGAWVHEMGGKLIRSIDLERARTHLGLRNLAYNLKRYIYLKKQAAQLR